MDFKQLEAFVGVARLGSFSRAAERMFLTQPTISAHIKALEEELGVQLVVRAPKEAKLSHWGEKLYDYALDLLSLRDSAIAACTERGGMLTGAVVLAASTVPSQHVLPRATAVFRQLHPAVTFALTSCDSAGVVANILSGKAEIGLTGTMLKNPKLTYRDFMEDELVVATPPTEPYAGMAGDMLDARDLLGAPLILREPGSGTRRELEAYLARRGMERSALRVVAQMDNPDAVKNAVAQGLGVSVMSRLSCADDARLGRLRLFHLGGKPLMRKLYLVCPAHRALSPAAKEFYGHVMAEGGAYFA